MYCDNPHCDCPKMPCIGPRKKGDAPGRAVKDPVEFVFLAMLAMAVVVGFLAGFVARMAFW